MLGRDSDSRAALAEIIMLLVGPFSVLVLNFRLLPTSRERARSSPMMICQDCGIDFPLLADGSTCQKCRLLDGQSVVEKVVIKVSYC